jgi:hypothetical protein
MGHTIDIVWSTTLVHDHDALGMSDYRNQRIILQENTYVYPVPRTIIEQAYLHELIHFIFGCLGEIDLRDNEQLVDNVAGLLNQALQETE